MPFSSKCFGACGAANMNVMVETAVDGQKSGEPNSVDK